MALAKHPDRGGSTEAFQEINKDFEALTTLFLLRESQVLQKAKDPTKLSFMQRAIDSLQSLIRNFLYKAPKTEKELNEYLQPLTQTLSLQCDPETLKMVEEAMKIERKQKVANIFAKFRYDLQQYVDQFATEAYDNEKYLLDTADDDLKLGRVLDKCDVRLQGHRDQFKEALQALKRGDPPTLSNVTRAATINVDAAQLLEATRQRNALQIHSFLPFYSLTLCARIGSLRGSARPCNELVVRKRSKPRRILSWKIDIFLITARSVNIWLVQYRSNRQSYRLVVVAF